MKNTMTLNTRRMYYANNRGQKGYGFFNCWGATLFVLGANNRLTWQHGSDMQRWLNKETKQIGSFYKIPKSIVPGDILVIHSSLGLEHTAVYVGSGRYFHKKGRQEAEITDLQGVLKEYPYKPTWRRIR